MGRDGRDLEWRGGKLSARKLGVEGFGGKDERQVLINSARSKIRISQILQFVRLLNGV